MWTPTAKAVGVFAFGVDGPGRLGVAAAEGPASGLDSR